jgi:uncharacterized protein (DUF1697 family)
VLLLRGINLGARNRISMPELRQALEEAGFKEVRTHLQSGNVVVASRAKPETVARKVEREIAARFGLEISVVARTRAELAEVVKRNPFGSIAKNRKRYQVTFLSAQLAPEVVERLESKLTPGEKVAVIGREVYAWHPEGIAGSPVWSALASGRLGVTATSRNWTTIEALLEMAAD